MEVGPNPPFLKLNFYEEKGIVSVEGLDSQSELIPTYFQIILYIFLQLRNISYLNLVT